MRNKGFTIIEVLTVVIIIGMLAVFVVPRMFKGLGKARRDIAKSKMAIIESALGRFFYDCGRFPTQDEGLEALLIAPAELEEKWNGSYLKQSDLLDPWDNPYEYVAEGVINAGSFDLISYGADKMEGGQEGTDDEDIYND
ncbi:MAG TPA: type II secretion system major pseudopilin GspG [Planctomycetes bacterium]|nr:type II secretion system major pseudopilin GspG [Planctomycetota bacterium]HIJ70491.1 type II secretion system major pseudopilin GspG [Planctomycetota bacterium]